MKPYFYVYRENVGQAPTIRHATLELAQAEAERLAVKHTGSVSQILKCVGFAQVTGPASTFFMDGEGPVHPCEAREIHSQGQGEWLKHAGPITFSAEVRLPLPPDSELPNVQAQR
jgi:hypothetical protein